MPDFTHVDTWIFDLDNTLYPADCNLFAQIDERMTSFVAETLDLPRDAARRVQKEYYRDYGTTLNGMMVKHAIEPSAFLAYVHDIDLSPVSPAPDLAARIETLPGAKYVFTNGSADHAANVMARLGVAHVFDDVYDIQAAEFLPKPHHEAYRKFLDRHAIAPKSSAMFEDLPQNLIAPFDLGMTTVLVRGEAPWIAEEPACKRPALRDEDHDHVHHAIDDLIEFLGRLRHAESAHAAR